ncbi:MAG: protein phosphatase 2C domain-containing protein [Anaerolineae bacterium]|nr:protein phosphatase 2C domain-containing protein [Anaerolineae bacterium]
MPFRLEAVARTDLGRERELNEDRAFQQVIQSSDEDAVGLFIVADGMGGHLAGEVASHWAVETIKRELADLFVPRDPRATWDLSGPELRALADRGERPRRVPLKLTEQRVRTAVEKANAAVHGYARHRPAEAMGAGSTVTMAVVEGPLAFIANVGDSRAYLVRNHQLQQITMDHSLVAGLVAAGRITLEESYDHPQAGLIYRCLGYMHTVEVDIFRQELQVGDVLLLCTDGLWEMVRDPNRIVGIIEEAPTLDRAAQWLVQAANAAGGKDNISVVLVRVTEGVI